jgi:hypothetical protein
VKVIDFGGTHIVHSAAELEQVLQARFKHEMNEFSLSDEPRRSYPLLVIYARGDLATMFYYKADDRLPGYTSIGGEMNWDSQKMTNFSIDNLDPGESIDVWNHFVVPFSKSVEVAKEFFHSREMPHSIEWFEL